jgi:ABC-2 type transport system permease protein
MPSTSHIYRLGVKELWSLARDPIMLLLIAYSFTASIYVAATALPETLHHVPIAVVDEDASPLSRRIVQGFFRPRFNPPQMVSLADADAGLDSGDYTFVLDIPPDFQRDIFKGSAPRIQLNIDATRMTQAFSGGGYVQQIVSGEVEDFVTRYRDTKPSPVGLTLRARFNPNLQQSWFGALTEMINNVTMLGIILTGAALLREREHGTIEHLLVMPITPSEIMLSKIWSMSAVVLLAAIVGLLWIVKGILQIPIEGSLVLFMLGAAIHLFAATSLGIFMATVARSMPQFGMLAVLILLPLQLLSGSFTPRESLPSVLQFIMLAAPTTHFVALGQAILFRGAGLSDVWPHLSALMGIGVVFFSIALMRFRKSLSENA